MDEFNSSLSLQYQEMSFWMCSYFATYAFEAKYISDEPHPITL